MLIAIMQGAARMGAHDIATARVAFKNRSGGMIEYLAAHADEQDDTIIVHCTMTFEGKGAVWVQRPGKVMNPYEGAMMLHCGNELKWTDPLPQT